jgi:hypothetical protein
MINGGDMKKKSVFAFLPGMLLVLVFFEACSVIISLRHFIQEHRPARRTA